MYIRSNKTFVIALTVENNNLIGSYIYNVSKDSSFKRLYGIDSEAARANERIKSTLKSIKINSKQ